MDSGYRRRLIVAAATGAALVGGYLGLAAAGQQVGGFGAYSLWYLPAGVSFAVSLLWGWRWWPALAVGELLAGIVVFRVDHGGFTWPVMIINAAGYTGVYVLAGTGLRRAGIVSRVDRVRDLVTLVVVGAGLAPLVAAAFGVAMRVWAHAATGATYWNDVRTWWVGDALGIATIAPGAMVVGLGLGIGGRRLIPPSLRRSGAAVTAAELIGPALVAAGLFAVWGSRPAVLSLLAIPIVGVALRFGVGGSALATLILAPTVAVLAQQSVGRVLPRSDLQVLLLGLVIVGFVVGVVVDERERAGQRQRELAGIVEATSDLVAIVRADGRVAYINRAGRRLARRPTGDGRGPRAEDELYAAPPGGPSLAESRRIARRDGIWSGDVTLQPGGTGEPIPAWRIVLAHYGADGSALRTASIVRDTSDEHALRERLDQQAATDTLTGLPNRAAFLSELGQLQRRLRYSGAAAAVLVVQFGRVPQLQAAVGHATTDEIIRAMSQRVVHLAGPSAYVAHLDPARFAILVPDPAVAGDPAMLAAYTAALASGYSIGPPQQMPIEAHVGVGELPGIHADESEALLAAEVAARHAATRRVPVAAFEPDHHRAERDALGREARLRSALDGHLWHLVYQPIVMVDTGEVAGAEALLRFDTGEPGASPYSLILLAEELGLIDRLGREVLRAACTEAVQWAPAIAVNVNVSRHEVTPGLVETVGQALTASGLDPDRLILEITESAVTTDLPRLIDAVTATRSLGVRIALDDFGTGYSSLATLDQLPVDIVKLDKSFTRGLHTSPRKPALVQAVISLADSLGIVVVAEGIETPDELATLVDLGCHEAQGFLLSRPGPATHLRVVSRARPPAVPAPTRP